MKKTLRYTITGVEIPEYLIDILLTKRCSSFLEMNIFREQGGYAITYDNAYYSKVEIGKLELVEKLRIAQDIFFIKNECDECLIRSEEYMISPELIYKRHFATEHDRVKLLFYPDSRKRKFADKALELFAKLFSESDKSECESLQNVEVFLRDGDVNRAERQLIRLIDRVTFAA